MSVPLHPDFKLKNDKRYETDYDVIGSDAVYLLFVRQRGEG